MEKESKLKNKIFKILPKAAAAAAAAMSVTFQNPPFSPGRDHKFKHYGGKGFFSVPMIPDEARRKAKNVHGVETQEPTSPKISCMGQIKHKKKQIKKGGPKNMSMPTPRDPEEKKPASKFQRMLLFHAGKPKRPAARRRQQSDADVESERAPAPPLGHMRRFASGRETFSNFDWKAQIAPHEERDCYSDYDDFDRLECDAEDEIIIPFSAPLTVGGATPLNLNVQPRKKINLWKRRTMAPPRPLLLNPVLSAK